jgi:hypothetical protein
MGMVEVVQEGQQVPAQDLVQPEGLLVRIMASTTARHLVDLSGERMNRFQLQELILAKVDRLLLLLLLRRLLLFRLHRYTSNVPSLNSLLRNNTGFWMQELWQRGLS